MGGGGREEKERLGVFFDARKASNDAGPTKAHAWLWHGMASHCPSRTESYRV